MAMDHTITRRQFMITTAVVGGAFVLGFALPSRRAEAAIAGQRWTNQEWWRTKKTHLLYDAVPPPSPPPQRGRAGWG